MNQARIERVYEPAARGDGMRVLVDRFWKEPILLYPPLIDAVDLCQTLPSGPFVS